MHVKGGYYNCMFINYECKMGHLVTRKRFLKISCWHFHQGGGGLFYYSSIYQLNYDVWRDMETLCLLSTFCFLICWVFFVKLRRGEWMFIFAGPGAMVCNFFSLRVYRGLGHSMFVCLFLYLQNIRNKQINHRMWIENSRVWHPWVSMSFLPSLLDFMFIVWPKLGLLFVDWQPDKPLLHYVVFWIGWMGW